MSIIKTRALIVLLISSLLLGSWILPITKEIWDVVDVWAYRFFNSLLASQSFAYLIGIASQHLADFIFDLMIGAWLIYAIRSYPWQYVVGLVVTILGYEIITHLYISKGLIPFLVFDRLSPSLVLQGGIDILAQVPFGGIKTAAHYSFPGDHATTYFMAAFFIYMYAGARYGILAMMLASLFCIPRIVVGAHWFTDVFVGGVATAGFLCGCAGVVGMVDTIAGFVSKQIHKLPLQPGSR